MNRRVPSMWFGILLLLSQLVQGATADAMRCADADAGSLQVSAVAQHCGSGHAALHAAASQPCPFCTSGACKVAHAPAVPLVLGVIDRPILPSYEPTWRSDERLGGRTSRILRPPR